MSTIALPEAAPPTHSLSKKILQVAAACLLLAICAGILAAGMTSNSAANRDFISYWAAGQRIAHGADPYNGLAILKLEKSAGWQPNRPLIMRNPPFALFLTIPLGFVNAKTGAVLWSLAILLCLMTSLRLLRRMHGCPNNRLHLLGYVFAPALACLLAGQTSAFVLLGLTFFLYFHRSRQFLSGAALLLCALKPHLFLPFGVVLLAWIGMSKAYRILAGATLALSVSCALSFLFDRSIYAQYSSMAGSTGIEGEFVPTLSELFRIAIRPEAAWLQFLPALLTSIWALWYFRRSSRYWDWSTHGSLLLMISVLVAPYAWLTDQVVLLPAILQVVYSYSDSSRDRPLIWFALVDGTALCEVLSGVQLDSVLFTWTAAAWLAWYLWAMHPSRNPSKCPEPVLLA